MRTEVEMKIKLKEDLKEIYERLVSLGYQVNEVYAQCDTYFDSKDSFIKDGGLALRIREDRDLLHNKVTYILNSKGIKGPNGRAEEETILEHPDEMRKIFHVIGFDPVGPVVSKVRAELVKTGSDITVCLDDVYGLGLHMEAEIVCDDAEKEEATRKISGFLSEIGYASSEAIPASYLGLLVRAGFTGKPDDPFPGLSKMMQELKLK